MASPVSYSSVYDSLAAALGGRRIFAIVWFLWFFVSLSAFFITDPDEMHPLRGRAGGLILLCGLTVGLYLFIILRALIFGTHREHIFGRVEESKKPSKEICFLVRYVIPILCLGGFISRWFSAWFFE